MGSKIEVVEDQPAPPSGNGQPMQGPPCCGNCPVAGPIKQDPSQVECHRFPPPMPIPVGRQGGIEVRGAQVGAGVMISWPWPTVLKTQCCGEHPVLKAAQALEIENLMNQMRTQPKSHEQAASPTPASPDV